MKEWNLNISKKSRNSNIEMLRIVAILFIIVSHSSYHGIGTEMISSIAVNNFFLDWATLGNLGVDIFVLISGYFICEKESCKVSIARLLPQVWFYSLFSCTVYILCGYKPGIEEIIKTVLPTIFEEYWFFTAYIVMLLLAPYVNIFLSKITARQHRECVFVMLVMWVIIPTFTTRNMFGFQIAQFVMLYCIGAYFRKNLDNIMKIKNVRILVTIISFMLLYASSVVIRLISKHISILDGYQTLFYGRNSLLIIGIAIGMFSIAVYRRPYTNKTVNTVSSCIFGVYLLHDNPLMRKIIWQNCFPNYLFINSFSLIPRMLISCIIIFAVASLFEYARKLLLEKPLTDIMLKIINWLNVRLGSIVERVDRIVRENLNS